MKEKNITINIDNLIGQMSITVDPKSDQKTLSENLVLSSNIKNIVSESIISAMTTTCTSKDNLPYDKHRLIETMNNLIETANEVVLELNKKRPNRVKILDLAVDRIDCLVNEIDSITLPHSSSINNSNIAPSHGSEIKTDTSQ